MRLIVITGISGSGKTQALRIFEDLGYFCVDNLPPALLPQLAEQRNGNDPQIACVIDSRAGEQLNDLQPALKTLRDQGVDASLLFMEATDETLVNRFKETRRKHPLLATSGGILPSIQAERTLLTELKLCADKTIDTTEHTPRSLSTLLGDLFGGPEKPSGGLVISIISFGFKYGLPLDADLVFDVRFLANPHYVRKLRWQDGRQPEVVKFINQDPLTEPFRQRLQGFVEFTLPAYIKEGKAYLTIAIGCTGGRHRSVMVAEELCAYLRKRDHQPILQHRDVRK